MMKCLRNLQQVVTPICWQGLLCLALVLMSSHQSFAQQHTICTPVQTWDGTTTQTFADIPIDIPVDIHERVNYRVESARIRVKVSIEENGVFPYGKNDQFQFSFQLNGDAVDAQNNSGYLDVAFPAQPIVLSANVPEIVFVSTIDVKKFILNQPVSNNPLGLASNTMLTLKGLQLAQVSNTGTTVTIPANQVKVEVCYEFKLPTAVGESTVPNTTSSLHQAKMVSIPAPLNQGSAYRNFQWKAEDASNQTFYAPFYEFQLLKIENTNLATPQNEYEVKTQEDWGNALSFIVPEDKLNKANGFYTFVFRPSEGAGYYLWRVRPIGCYYTGGMGNNQNWGLWNTATYTSLYVTDPIDNKDYIFLNNATLGLKDCFYYNDIDEEHNYSYSRSFTEDGKVFEQMTYADKLLRVRQNQTYLPAENKTLVGQSLYDQLGRSSISVMPVPVDGTLKGYKEQLVTNPAGDLYKVEDFGVDAKVYNPSTIADNGVYSYYSDNNPDTRIPDAEGYPFSRTLYSTDGLNRVIEQSGVGARHMVGTDAQGRGKTTKTNIQVGVHDAELVSIFGVEAPNADQVTKQVVVDPNGTSSVTYVSRTGKTLATAIAPPLNPATYQLEPLDNSAINQLTIQESLSLGEYSNGQFVSSKELELVQAIPNMQFKYKAPCGGAGMPACLNGQNCSYEVTIKILKLLTDPNDLRFNLTAQPDQIYTEIYSSVPVTITSCTTQTIVPSSVVTLERGTYKIIKEVKPVGAGIQAAIDAYQLQVEQELGNYMNLIYKMLDQVGSDTDWLNVQSGVNSLNQYITGSINVITLETAFNTLYPGVFLPDDFIGLTTTTVQGAIYLTGQTSTVDGRSVDHVELVIQDCDGNNRSIQAAINNQDEPFNIGQNGPYVYRGVAYDFPPFVEYFIDQVGMDIYNDPNEPDTVFKEFFNGYKYWDITVSDPNNKWEAIDDNFVATYNTEINKAIPDQAILKRLNANQFNRMIWHMLNDEYYVGRVRYDATNSQYQYYNEGTQTWDPYNNATQKEVQYDVEQLKRCWVNVFGGIKQMLQVRTQIANSNLLNDLDNSINDNAGANTFQNTVNDNMPWILRLFFGNSLNDQMSNNGANGGIQPDFANMPLSPVHLPKQFLACTGYKHARIIDPVHYDDHYANGGFTPATSYSNYVNTLPTAQQHIGAATHSFNTHDVPLEGSSSLFIPAGQTRYYGIPTYSSEEKEYYSTLEYVQHSGSHELHTFNEFPFVQNLVFAFKYYEYWDRNLGSSFPHPWDTYTDQNGGSLSLNSIRLDRPFSCLMCEQQYGYEADSQACSSSSTGHDEWTWEQRHLFRDCVTDIHNNGKLPADSDDIVVHNSTTLWIGLDATGQNCVSSAGSELTTLIQDCETICENRRPEFRRAVIEMFENACYSVGQCSGQATDYVTVAEVDQLVDQLVDECQGNCGLTLTTNVRSCLEIGGVTVRYCDAQLGDLCEKTKQNIAKTWKVRLFIAPAPGCTNTVPATGTPTNCPNPNAIETPIKEISSTP